MVRILSFAHGRRRLLLIARCKQIERGIKRMALTRFEYVKSFEIEDKLEPLQWIVLHLELSNHKTFLQSNHVTALQEKSLRNVMLASTHHVVKGISEIALSYQYSNIANFVFQRDIILYRRRASKLLTYITSLFTSGFTSEWDHFIKVPLRTVPVLEGSVYLLPHDQCLRDFLSKEQKLCHEINLTETVFLNLVKVAQFESSEALAKAQKSSESEKNEILFSLCNVNYNNEPPKDKKGTILYRKVVSTTAGEEDSRKRVRIEKELVETYEDFTNNSFWSSCFPLQETKVNSNFRYLDLFQRISHILPHSWLVVRIDGKGFHKFSELHNFEKPNEIQALRLMSASAENVMSHFPIVFLAYGQSDEYSFVIRRYGHREKNGYSLISKIVSVFTATFVQLWAKHFKDQPLLSKPSFDARLVLYPTIKSLRDYLSWRQADCHINNMYNTCFWNLVNKKGLSRHKAQEHLKGTFSKDKLAILRDECGIEYSKEDALYRKGTIIISQGNLIAGKVASFLTLHEDLIGDQFWLERPWLLADDEPEPKKKPVEDIVL